MEGGVMRAVAAASKVAGIVGGFIHRGLRRSAAVPPVEQSMRLSPMPAWAILSSSSSSSSSAKATVSDVVGGEPLPRVVFAGRPSFDEAKEVTVSPMPASAILSSSSSSSSSAKATVSDVVGGEPLPRVVFAGPPSFDEAKGASVESKDALDEVRLFTPESSESGQVVAANQFSGLSMHSNLDFDTNSCLAVETAGGSPVPNPALKAFMLLSQSREVQDVVTGIVSDPNVRNAVMQNSAFQDFMKSNQHAATFQEQVFPENVENSSEGTKAGGSEDWFQRSVRNIKQTVENITLAMVELVSNLSSSLQNIFGFSLDVNGNKKATTLDITIASSFMGLATLFGTFVLLKRV